MAWDVDVGNEQTYARLTSEIVLVWDANDIHFIAEQCHRRDCEHQAQLVRHLLHHFDEQSSDFPTASLREFTSYW